MISRMLGRTVQLIVRDGTTTHTHKSTAHTLQTEQDNYRSCRSTQKQEFVRGALGIGVSGALAQPGAT